MVQETDGSGDEERGSKKRTRAVETVKVKVVERWGKAVLLEWHEGGRTRRGSVPASKLQGDECDTETLKAAAPHGEEWEKLGLPALDAEALAEGLRREGVWTKEDFVSNLHLVRAAVQRVYLNPLIAGLTARLRE
jgi:hypothetical protein